MDVNCLIRLLVTCVFFQMYTTPALIQSTYNSGDVTTNTLAYLQHSTLHYLCWGGRGTM